MGLLVSVKNTASGEADARGDADGDGESRAGMG